MHALCLYFLNQIQTRTFPQVDCWRHFVQVGVLIGKAGDTIKYLQINSGAKIQITRDAEADPHSTTRPVELIGTVENINKAKQLIKDVIAEVHLI